MNITSIFSHGIYEDEFVFNNTDNIISTIDWETSSNMFCQSTNKNLHLTEEFKKLADTVSFKASLYWEQLGYIRRNFFVTQMWANKMQGHGVIHPHFHSNSLISGVVYLSMDEQNSGGTVFYNPLFGSNQLITIPEKTDTEFNRLNFTVKPKQNKLILFPSYLHHSSEKSFGNAERITVSFNLLPEILGSEDHINYLKLGEQQ